MKRDIERTFDQRATVYTRAAGGGFTTQNATGIKCLLQPVGLGSQAAAVDRAQDTESGTLYFAASYTMPEPAEFTVDAFPGKRYHVVVGSVWAQYGLGGVVIANVCDVRRAR